MNSELAKRIELAKGADRSIREYAAAAGVNIATVSRAIKGEITPSVKMLKKLTSEEAKPRNGITFESLYAAVGVENIKGSKEDYALAIGALTAGAIGGALASPFSMFTMLAGAATAKALSESKKIKKDKKNSEDDKEKAPISERMEKFRKQQELFAATAMGILYGALAKKGLNFRPGVLDSQDTNGYGEEKLICIENSKINKWKFNFFSCVDNDSEINEIVERIASDSLLSLILTNPSESKKVSLVLKDKELFESIVDTWKTNSYRGNLSIVLIDLNNVCIANEVNVSSYELGNSECELNLL